MKFSVKFMPPRVLLLGETTSGKTGSVASLANAGYRILLHDFDNNSRVIANYLKPNHADIYIQTYDVARITDTGLLERVKNTNDPKSLRFSDRHETIYAAAVEQLNLFARLLQHWKTDTEDLGTCDTWTPKDVVVIDSGTFLGELCLLAANLHNEVNKNQQTLYRVAGGFMRNIFNFITSSTMGASVLVLTHILKTGEKTPEGDFLPHTVKYVPRGVGVKLSEDMPQYFSDVWRINILPNGDRRISTVATDKINLRTSAPTLISRDEPFDLASLFNRLIHQKRDAK